MMEFEMPLFADRIPAEVRARQKAWRRRVRQRLCIQEGSSDDRDLTRVILEWRMLRAKIGVMDRRGIPVAPEERLQLERLDRLLGEGQDDPARLLGAQRAA